MYFEDTLISSQVLPTHGSAVLRDVPEGALARVVVQPKIHVPDSIVRRSILQKVGLKVLSD